MDMKGIVFDIRRFSTHDGDGLRTTVFMKGCPLHCLWCQNPEGMETGILPTYFEHQCIHCGSCSRQCRHNGIEQKNGNLRLHRHEDEDWISIMENCPSGALRMDAREYTVEQLYAEVIKDQVFFLHGGGVTFSGGEPLMQSEFVGSVMKKLREHGIHTAIETSLAVKPQCMDDVLPYTSQIYADMKVYDDEDHQKYVGTSNYQITENLNRLLTSQQRETVTVRTPLIPGYTATENNLAAIAKFVSGIYPDVKYELLNYNPLAEAKYHLVDRTYCFNENPKLFTKEEMRAFGRIAQQHGIRNLIMEL